MPKDYVVALMYHDFSLLTYNLIGGENGKRRAKARDDVAKKLTPQQLAEAQRMAREWREVNYGRRDAQGG